MAQSKKAKMEKALALIARMRENPEDSVLDMDWFKSDLSPEIVSSFDDDFDIALPSPLGASKPIRVGLALPPVSGTCSITIRVPAWVVRAYKTNAATTGVRYQTQMNRVLRAGLESHV